MSKRNKKRTEICLSLDQLNSVELQSYCSEHPEQCADERLWRQLLMKRFSTIYSFAKDVVFPDLEKELRSIHRKFAPLRELYTELLVSSESRDDTDMFDIIEDALNDREFNLYNVEDVEFLRCYYQTLSYLLGIRSSAWRRMLVEKNDLLVDFLTFSLEEMENYLHLSPKIAERYFTDPRVNPRQNHNWSILWAARNGHTGIVRLLLSLVDPTAEDNEAIRKASREGHVEIVRFLLADGRADPTAKDNQALRHAASKGRAAVVSLLLPHTDPTARNHEAMRMAATSGHLEVVRLLLQDGRSNPSFSNYALFGAVHNGHEEVVKLLLSDARVSPTDIALHAAIRKGRINILRLLLLDPRIDPNSISSWMTHYVSYGYEEAIRVLLSDHRINRNDIPDQVRHLLS